MSNCQDKPTLLPESLWKALMNLPALRYMKAPVNTEAELYEKYPIGNEKGTFAFVHNDNTFYTYHPSGRNRGKWKPISADGVSSFFEIDAEFLKEGDILVYDCKKEKFVVKSGNVWNRLLGDLKDSFVQVTKFLNQVDEVPTDESDSGVYFVHKDENNIEFRALYIVLGKKAIKIYQSSDYYTANEVKAKLDKKANQTQVDDIAASVDVLAVTKAEKSVVDALLNGIIKQPSVDTYNDTSGGKTSLLNKYPNPKIGWDVLVRSDETKGGRSNRYNWNGTMWVDMESADYPQDMEYIRRLALFNASTKKTYKETHIRTNEFQDHYVYCPLDEGECVMLKLESGSKMRTIAFSALDENLTSVDQDFAKNYNVSSLQKRYVANKKVSYINFYTNSKTFGVNIDVTITRIVDTIPSVALQDPSKLDIKLKNGILNLTFSSGALIDVWNRLATYTITIPDNTSYTISNKFSLIINPNKELEYIANYKIYENYLVDDCIILCQNMNGVPVGALSDVIESRGQSYITSSITWDKSKLLVTNYMSGSGVRFVFKEGVNLSARTSKWKSIVYNTARVMDCWNNHFLYWDMVTNDIVEGDSQTSLLSFILLARVENGQVVDGLFKDVFIDSNLLLTGLEYSRTITTVSSQYFDYPVKVDLKKGDIIKVRLQSNIKANVLSISLLNGKKDIVQLDFVRVGNATDTTDVYYQVPVDAAYVKYYINGTVGTEITFSFKLVKSIESTSILNDCNMSLPVKAVTDTAGSQGIVVVGDEIWHFHAAKDDHQTLAPFRVFDAKTLALKPERMHNIGHVNSCDYNTITDTFLACNENEKGEGIQLYLLPNAKGSVGNILIDNMIIISFIESSKLLNEKYGAACFGENENIVYVISRDSKKLFRVELGLGSNNFSDSTGTDLTRWGTFIPGKTNKEYNGTARILNTYSSLKDVGLMQGLCYHAGAIYLLVGYGHGDDNIHKIKCYSNGYFDVVDSYDIKMYDNDTQAELVIEPEGLTVYNGNYFLFGVISILNNGSKSFLCVSPLPDQNIQSGFGKTNERVLFHFPNRDTNPRVKITPTRTTQVPIYIDSIDQFGFTAKTSDNSAIEFYYECNIG